MSEAENCSVPTSENTGKIKMNMSRKRCERLALTLCCVLTSLCCLGQSQTLEERVKKLESQNAQLLEMNKAMSQRLDASETRNRRLETKLNEATEFQTQRSNLVIDEIGRLMEDLRPSASGGGDSAYNMTRSSSLIQFYGRLRLDLHYNTGRFNAAVDPRWVRPEDGFNAADNDEAFVMDVRTTTLGFNLDAGRLAGGRVLGKLEFDFDDADGGDGTEAESEISPRLLLAYLDYSIGNFSVRLGQDWDIISPYDPIVDAHRFLWDTGNLGDRRPMLSFNYQGGNKRGIAWHAGLAVGLTGAVDNLDADVGFGSFLSTERDGFDAGHPHLQLAFGVNFDSWVADDRIALGVSAAWGTLETDTEFNGEDRFTTWLIAFDMRVPLYGPVSLKAEAFIGQALGDFRGGIAQSIDTIDGDEIESIGGWAELHWQVNSLIGVAVGASIDNPKFEDLRVTDRDSNWAAYFATRFDWDRGLRSGFDVLFWKTQYVGQDDGDALRFSAFVELNF